MAALHALLLAGLVALALSHGKPAGVHVGHFPATYPENAKPHDHHSKKPAEPEPKHETPAPKKPEPEEDPKKPEPEEEPKKPAPVCSPSEWEGQAVGRVVIDGKSVSAFGFKTKISVSHKCQMEVYDTVTKVSEKEYIKTTTYRDFKNMKEFELDKETGKCKIARKIPVPMKQICSNSDNVKYMRSFMVGDSMADMIEVTDVGFIGKSVITVLQDSYVPVSSIATGKDDDGNDIYSALQYANVKAGCKDKSVFVLPAACQKCLHHGKKGF